MNIIEALTRYDQKTDHACTRGPEVTSKSLFSVNIAKNNAFS